MDEAAKKFKKVALYKLIHDNEIIELDYYHVAISLKIMCPLFHIYQWRIMSQER